MGKSVALATLIVLLLAGIGFQHYITSLPDLEAPMSLSSARFGPDGSSISASFQRNDGQGFHFGIRGNADKNWATAPLYFIRNPELVPYVHWPSMGGPDERVLLKALEDWVRSHITAEQISRFEQVDREDFGPEEIELAAVYKIYETLRSRNPGQ
ncbi:hypothetical protein [Marinobacter sp. F4216]|uniref:hypothetical protein n=1 Tax=Marinobacter sp. F4216 TaxID=2874281 RepID=UPI001CBC14FC|nr:hypothetical protein [Marinobacter sp. F4216]MBZ2167508.1 hypothetical protein [Marinobacter sp. F4216]